MRTVIRQGLRITSLLLLIVAVAGVGEAAVGDPLWVSGFSAEGGAVAVDGAGNVVAYGTFFSGVDFGGGTLTPVNIFDGDQYLARFDADGNHLWSQQFSPVGFGVSDEMVAVDPAGNIYLAGRVFNGSLDLGGGPLGADSLYVAKMAPNGSHLWSKAYGAGTVRGIAADGAHVVITGNTSAGVDFGGGMVGTAGGNDVFIARFSAAGAHVWSSGFGDADDQGGMAVSLDGSGNAVVAGTMFGTVDFGGGPLVANLLDLILVSFSPAGSHNWSRIFDGTFTPGGGILATVDVAAGPSGTVALAGELRGSTDFGGGTLTSSGFSDIFVARFHAGGAHSWSAVYGASTGSDMAQGVSMDGSGNVLVSGRISDDTDLGGGTVLFDGDPLNFERNIFVALYDSTGAHQFSAGYGKTPLTAKNCFDPAGRMMVYGQGGASLDFGSGPVSPVDFYIAKLEGAGLPTAVGDDLPTPIVSIRAAANPFHGAARIQYAIERSGVASVIAYDVLGRRVETLVPARPHSAGVHEVRFRGPTPGLYFLRVRSAGGEQTLKIVQAP